MSPFSLPGRAQDYPMWVLSLPWYIVFTFSIPPCGTVRQGVTLVHFSAQPEPFLTQNTPQTSPHTPDAP